MMANYDVGIVGAGPAGLTAANTLTKRGLSVGIFEEHKEIGLPVQCGEGISIYACKDFNIPLTGNSLIIREFKETKIFFPNNTMIKGDTHAFMIRRDLLDQLLANRAISSGAHVHTACKITEIIKEKDYFLLKSNSRKYSEFRCTYLLLAEGPRPKLALSLGFTIPSLIRAFEYKIQGEFSDFMEFYFDSEKYPMGYCWVFPRDDETNVGIVTTARNRKERLDNFLKERKINGSIVKKIGGSIPMEGHVRPLYIGNAAVIGDAAGMTNPLFYGGIRMAMTSGQVVARVISREISEKKNGDLSDYPKNLAAYPFMSLLNYKCHHYFYRQSNDFLSDLGEVFANQYINRIEKMEILKTLWKILKKRQLIKKPRGLYWLYKGFKIARDWGF